MRGAVAGWEAALRGLCCPGCGCSGPGGVPVPPYPPTPQGFLFRQLPLPGFVYARPCLQPCEVIPEDLSLPNPGADASRSLLQCQTPAFQDPFPTDGNEGFSSPFSLGLACCRRGVPGAIGG